MLKFADHRRRYGAEPRVGEEQHRVDAEELPVHLRHIAFILEVGHAAHSAQQTARTVSERRLRREAGVAHHVHVPAPGKKFLQFAETLFRLAFRLALVHAERHRHVAEQRHAALQDVQMPHGEGVETAGEKRAPFLDDPEGRYIVVATTRPETILGDTAVCVNPNDERYTWLKGKRVIVPMVGRSVPIIMDEYVEMDFGTGCLKVTPAHDVNDYMLGEKYNLPSIDIFNDNGTISEAAGFYTGMDRFDVREQIMKDLAGADLVEKVEDYDNKVGHSERTNAVIEPKLSMQ